MKRKIEQHKYQLKHMPVHGEPDLSAWLLAQAEEFGLTTLLAHADDGLIWGQVREGKLHLSSDHFPAVSPPLRTNTLQEGRLFGPSAELHLWRDEGGHWQSRLVQDDLGQPVEAFD
ncbi:MAG: CRISPR-associated protein Csx19, partial [Anaerolineae bacterium]